MTLRELVLTMHEDEKLMIRVKGEDWETTPAEFMVNALSYHDKRVTRVWASYNLYKAIMIEVE